MKAYILYVKDKQTGETFVDDVSFYQKKLEEKISPKDERFEMLRVEEIILCRPVDYIRMKKVKR